jgi:peptide subunit release factor 1 (eRF1)
MEKYLVKVFNKQTKSTRRFPYNSEREAQQKAKSFKKDPNNGVSILRMSRGDR